jgi:hypothetical protein
MRKTNSYRTGRINHTQSLQGIFERGAGISLSKFKTSQNGLWYARRDVPSSFQLYIFLLGRGRKEGGERGEEKRRGEEESEGEGGDMVRRDTKMKEMPINVFTKIMPVYKNLCQFKLPIYKIVYSYSYRTPRGKKEEILQHPSPVQGI